MPDELDRIRHRLETIAEELADLTMARLRDALEAGAGGPAADERRLSRARRAVERAIAALEDEAAGRAISEEP